VLWGAAAGGFTDTPRDQALKEWEQTTGRTAASGGSAGPGEDPLS
jgi:hypothetical protein